MNAIKPLKSNAEISAAFELIQELRPHLVSLPAYIEQVARQYQVGYRQIAFCESNQPLGLAGYRTIESLVHGRFIYVDDLVVSSHSRRKGIGKKLLEYIFREASIEGCNKVVLDTALSNSLAQRFYFREEMLATALHFSISLQDAA